MLELYLTIDKSEQSVVLTNAYVFACADSGTSLSYDDVAGYNGLTVCFLNAKTLGFAIATVLGRTDTFLMSKAQFTVLCS